MKTVWNILKVVLTGFLIWFLFRKTNLHSIGIALRSIKPAWYLAALALSLLQQVFFILRWHLLLKENGILLTWGQTTKYHFMSLLFQSFLPSGFGADAAKYVFTGKKGQRAESLNSVFVARMSGMFILMLFALFGSLYYKVEKVPHLTIWLIAISLIFIILALLVRLLPFERMTFWNRALFLTNIRKFLVNLKTNLRLNLLFPITGISLLLQIASVLPYLFLFNAMGFSAGIFKVLVLIPLITILTTVLPSVNGMGPRETFLFLFFKEELTTRATLGAFATLYYSIMIIILAVGLVFWLQSLVKKKETT